MQLKRLGPETSYVIALNAEEWLTFEVFTIGLIVVLAIGTHDYSIEGFVLLSTNPIILNLAFPLNS